jgi:hypothetical protein
MRKTRTCPNAAYFVLGTYFFIFVERSSTKECALINPTQKNMETNAKIYDSGNITEQEACVMLHFVSILHTIQQRMHFTFFTLSHFYNFQAFAQPQSKCLLLFLMGCQ